MQMCCTYYLRLAAFIVFIFSASLSIAQTTFVKTGGTGAGASWADAAGDLTLVLAQAQSGDEIWVASGVYNPTTCTVCNSSDRAVTFRVPTGVQLYGGFNGTETQLNQRSVSTNLTVLSGDIDANGQLDNNSYHVVTFENVNAQTRLDGFTHKDGFANGSNGRQHGGAISNDGSGIGNSSNPVIANCTFSNNHAANNGGAIYNKGYFGEASPTIDNCTFTLNSAGEGGAIQNQGFRGVSSPLIRNCLFDQNSSASGGAVYNSGNDGISNPRFENCHFIGNDCTGYGGAIYNFAKTNGGFCSPVFANCIFDDNSGVGAAGAIYTLGSTQGQARPEVVGCVFFDNFSQVGGAVYVNASDNGITNLHISNTIFSASRANYDPILHFSGNSNPVITLENVQLDASDCSHISGSGSGTLNCGAGLIFDANAQFVDAANGDFHLVATAPGIDAGDGSYFSALSITQDFDGNARIQGANSDLGAYEFVTGDSDGDGIPDTLDNCPMVANPAQIDGDGDGFGESCDCNDSDSLINPNALEICDGLDNNCNLQIDEAGGTLVFYKDTDGDTFGDPAVSVTACAQPPGFVVDNTDCDDTDSNTYPGAPEICDGKDNNCNNTVDEGAVDLTPPTISCTPLQITAAPGSTTTITPANVYGGGSDNCTSVNLVSVSPSSFLLAGTYTVTLTAEDDAGNQATCTTTVTITLQNSNGTYCSLSASQPWTEWVSNVKFADLDNASGKCGTTCGYSDFTSEVASILTGNDYDLVLTPGLSYNGYQPDLYWRTWIDWNQDGDFLDANELVASADATFAAVAQTVSVPATAASGTTRMRIAMRRDAAPEACTDFVFGEVEDYTVAIALGGPQVTIAACPLDQTIGASPGATSEIASWAEPTVSSTCPAQGQTITQVAGPPSGSAFPVGTTEIVYAASDACGSVDTCRFLITVSTQAAILGITCPPSQSIQLAPGQTTVVATWADATATTTCTGGAVVNQSAGLVSGASFGLGISTITYEATDLCGNTEVCSFSITVSPAPTNSGSYCDLTASQPWTEWVTNVAFADLDNASGKCGTTCGYSDFTAQVANVLTGTSYDLVLTPGLSYPGYQPELFWRTWIDWNQDGDFLDPGELVASVDATFAESIQAVTIPASAAVGTTRMRVAMRRGQAPEVCTNYILGEVEDYSVSVAVGGPNVVILNCPSSQSLVVLPGNSATIASWPEPTIASTCTTGGESVSQISGPVSGSIFPLGTTEIVYAAQDLCGSVDTCRFSVTVSAQPATLSLVCPSNQTIQLSSGQVEAAVTWASPSAVANCPGGAVISQVTGPTSGSSFSVGTTSITFEATDACGNVEQCSFTITVLPAQTNSGTYCTVAASQPWTEWVSNVAFADLDNASSKCGTVCGYSDFTSIAASVLTGNAYDLTLTPGLSYNGYQPSLYWRVWIDWNQNGDFLDTGELVASVDDGFSVVTQSVNVPATASTGFTRMRVAMRRDEAPSACINYIHGEVEDYSVFVSAGSAPRQGARTGSGQTPLRSFQDNQASSLHFFPNPAQDLLSITADEGMVQIELFSLTGQIMLSLKPAETQNSNLDLSQVKAGCYVVSVVMSSGERISKRLVIEK